MEAPASLEVLFTPAEFNALAARDLSRAVCVVFDVLRATSTMLTALAHGAAEIIPVEDIPAALALRRRRPEVLLAGERNGVRILAGLTGGIDFDLGNSPREFTAEKVRGRTVVISTTNGTRALRACAGARQVLLGSFLNLGAVARWLAAEPPPELLLVCSGTLHQAAFEDTLGAGALCDRLWAAYAGGTVADSALMARQLYLQEQANLAAALQRSRNGRRLLGRPELRDDLAVCAQLEALDLVAALEGDGVVRCLEAPGPPAASP